MYSMEIFCLYYSKLRPRDYLLVFQVFCYLSGTLNFGITFQTDSNNKLIGYTDSDYAGLVDSQKSSGKYIFMLSNKFLFYWLKLKITLALFSSKVEYMTV